MRTVEQEQDARELGLPPSVQEALGELVNAAKDGLLALSVGVGLGVLAEMMEAEVDEVVGPEGQAQPRPDGGAPRSRGRRGHARRPTRRRDPAAGEDRRRGAARCALATYAHFADRDPLTRVVLEQMLAGVSTRRFSRTREPVGEDVARRRALDIEVECEPRVRRPHPRAPGRS